MADDSTGLLEKVGGSADRVGHRAGDSGERVRLLDADVPEGVAVEGGAPADSDDGDARLCRGSGDTDGRFAGEALLVEASLAGDDEVGAGD